MKVSPVASPSSIPTVPSNDQGAKARAMNAFVQAAAPIDQNQVSPEDMAQAPQEELLEAAPEVTPEPPKEDPALSRQFAQLARQEKALRMKAQQQDQALKAREAALAAKEQELASKSQWDPSKYVERSRLQNDTWGVLNEEGLSYDELTQRAMNQRPTDPRVEATIKSLEAKIQALESQGESSKKSQAEAQTQAYQAAVKQIKVDTQSLVNQDPSFEMIKATKSYDDVVELITQTYDKDGILLSVEEAAQEVENYLFEEASKLTRIQKIQKRLAETSASTQPKAPSKPAGTEQKQTQPVPMKTLTNAQSSTRQLSARERAILAATGQNRS